MWQLVIALLGSLLTFSALSLLLVRMLVKTFSESLGEATLIQAKALAAITEPMFRPAHQDPAQVQDLDLPKTPAWVDEADSPDLIDNFGRPLTWETPVISEDDSVTSVDLWARPS